MSAGEPVLGAVGLSGRAVGKKWAENAPGTAHRTQNGAKPQLRTRHSTWHLAGVQAYAFTSANSRSKRRQFTLRTTMFFALAVYERRTHPSGRAVCLLGVRHSRFMACTIGLALLVAGAGVFSPFAGTGLAIVMVGLLLPRCVGTVHARSGKRQLGRLTPPGQHVYVHSLASTLPGAGAELLRTVIREADSKGRPVVLDASNEKLAGYYGNLGFCALGPAVRMPDGICHVRMWRPAGAPEGRA